MQALIDYIEGGHSLNEFLDDFPSVTREIAVAALEQAKAHLIADARAASGVVTHIHDWYALIDLVLKERARHPEARVPHLGRAPRRIARVSKDSHKLDRAGDHPSRRRFAANGLQKSARSAALEGYDAARKARRVLMTAFSTFRGGAEHACCRACYVPVWGAAKFAFCQHVQIDDEGSL